MPKGLPDFTPGQYILAQDPAGNPIILQADGQGRLVIVAYGQHAGTPKALAVDAEGRLITMASGMYDTQVKPLATDEKGRLLMVPIDLGGIWGVASPVTLSELAIRLGSPKRYDRGGEVLWMDSFWYGTQAWEIFTSTNSRYSIVTYPARTGGFSLRLTTEPAAGGYVTIQHYEPYLAATRFGAEISWTYTDLVSMYTWTFTIGLLDGTWQAAVKYDPVLRYLYYRNAAGNYVVLSYGFRVLEASSFFNTIKIVVDAATKKWVKLMLNNSVFDLSTESLYQTTPATFPAVAFLMHLDSREGYWGTVHVDDAIITQNEP